MSFSLKHFSTIFGRVAISMVLSCGLFVFNQTASFAQPQLERTPSNTASDRQSPESLQGSQNAFKLSRSQSVIQCFEIIRQSIARGDHAAVLPLIERVLSEPDTYVPGSNSSDVPSHAEIWRILRTLPGELRQSFEEARRPVAKRAWEEARLSGPDAVRVFLSQFSDSPFCIDAWWWIGCHERDHGRYRYAAAAFERASRQEQISGEHRVAALVAALDCCAAINLETEMARLKSMLSRHDGDMPLKIAGNSIRLKEYLAASRFESIRSAESPAVVEIESSAEEWKKIRPVFLPIWKQEFVAPLRANLETLEQQQRDQGIRPVLIARPLVVGQSVIVRALNEIRSFDLASGQPQWSIANTEFKLLGKRAQETSGLQGIATEWAQRRTQADSIFARMSTDGRRLFVIQEVDRASELRVDREPLSGILRAGPRFNKLCCYTLETGELAWELGEAPGNGDGPFTGKVFLGPPCIVDDLLFVVAQRESDLFLLTLSAATGQLRLQLPLGSTSLPIEADLLRSRVACAIVWHEGRLICPTSSGAIFAVDPLLQMPLWSYRYRATTVSAGDLARIPGLSSGALNHEAWWESWREPFLAVVTSGDAEASKDGPPGDPPASAVLVFASPESDQLHGIRMEDGSSIWRTPRNGGLFVAGSVDDHVIVVEGDSVRSHDVRTGQVRWRTTTGEISSPAVIDGSVIVLPVRAGGTVLINARDGKVLSDSAASDSSIGLLTQAEPGWVAFHRQGLTLLPRLGEVRRQVDRDLEQDPTNESLRVRAALLDLQAGDEEAARNRLAGLTSSPARDLRRQALISALSRDKQDQSVIHRTDLARELTELADNADYKFAAAAAIGTSALALNDFVNAVDACLSGLSGKFDPSESLTKRSSVLVRKDRMLLGLIEEAYRRAAPADVVALDDLFGQRLKLARKSRDRLALQELADLWRGLDWGRRLVVSDEEKSLRKRSFVETELRLLDAAGSEEAAIAARALDRLAERLERLGLWRDSLAYRERRQQEHPDAVLLEGRNDQVQNELNASRRDEAAYAVKSLWPKGLPQVDPPHKDRNFGVYAPLVPMHIEPGSLAARLDVAVDRTGSDVIFRGETFFQSGDDEDHERKFPLPKSFSPYRGPSGYMLREGWGIGRIVILLIGSELFAITPLDEQGEPNSRFLWSNPIDLQLPAGGTKIAPAKTGIHEKTQLVTDDLNRPIGKVGPVRAGYLCYQSGNRLVAIETQTGRELWRRLGCPSNVTVLGDDHRVYLWSEDKTLEVLSAIDGRKLQDGEWPGSPQAMIHSQGAFVWTVARGEQTMLSLRDLKSSREVWSRMVAPQALVAVLDDQTFAVVTGDGRLSLLNARTGQLLGEPLSVDGAGMIDITAWEDPEHWYIGLSKNIENLSALKSLQPHDGYRVKFLNGPLYAVSRDGMKIVWSREFKNEPLGLDQSRVAPALVQIWKNPAKDNREAHRGTVRVIDRRTGSDLFEKTSPDVLPYFLLNPDHEQAIFELKLTQETIRFRYTAEASSTKGQSPEISKPQPE